MIEEHAVIVGIDGDQALLEIVRSKPCGLCGQTRGCGVSLWGRLLGHRNNVFRAENRINARVGDNVVVGVDEKALLAGSLAVYGVPLVLLLTGAALGGALLSSSFGADIGSLVGAVMGLALSMLWLRGHSARRGLPAKYRPVMLRAETGRDVEFGCKSR
jgi:sigma-E factor negative regulatory protein RseC